MAGRRTVPREPDIESILSTTFIVPKTPVRDRSRDRLQNYVSPFREYSTRTRPRFSKTPPCRSNPNTKTNTPVRSLTTPSRANSGKTKPPANSFTPVLFSSPSTLPRTVIKRNIPSKEFATPSTSTNIRHGFKTAAVSAGRRPPENAAVTYRRTPSSSSAGTRSNNPVPSARATPKSGVLRYPVSTPTSRSAPTSSNGTPSNGTPSNGTPSNGTPSTGARSNGRPFVRPADRVPPKGSATDMKSLPPRKATSIRNGTVSRPSPLRDHNGRLGQPKQADESPSIKGPAAAVIRRPGMSQRVGHAAPRTTTTSGPAAAAAAAAARTAEAEAALRRAELRATAAEAAARESGAGVVALGVVVNYLANTLDAFSSPELKKEIEKVKKDWALTKQELEETRAEVLRLREEQQQSAKDHEAASALLQSSQQLNEELRQKLEFANDDYTQKLVDLRHEFEVQALTAREESSRRETKAAEVAREAAARLEALQVELDAATSRADREAELRRRLEGTLERRDAQVRREVEDGAARRDAEHQARVQALEAEAAALRDQNRRVADCIKGDKDAKMQALAERCRELQDETESLRSVLEMRSMEMQQLRTQNLVLHRDADQLPGALQRVATLAARVEDLELQLERKNLSESQLFQENQVLQESITHESKLKRLLSYENEQLQWRLKNVSAFQSSGFANGWATNSMTERSSSRSQAPGRRPLSDDASPPSSPKILGVVEKSDSVSYVLDLDASDFCLPDGNSSTPSASEVPRSLPPPKRQCCKNLNSHLRPVSNGTAPLASAPEPRSNPLMQSASTSVIPSARATSAKKRSVSFRARSKSISSDSGECLSSGNWSPPVSLEHAAAEAAGEADRDPLALCSPTPYGGARNNPCECSDIEDFSSSKSSSMSCSSEGSELCKSEPERNGEPKEEKNELMKSSLTLPKESGGEAMISEEVTEDEDNDGSNSCCSEDGSCSEEDTSSSG